jgi:hypothetical protein
MRDDYYSRPTTWEAYVRYRQMVEAVAHGNPTPVNEAGAHREPFVLSLSPRPTSRREPAQS